MCGSTCSFLHFGCFAHTRQFKGNPTRKGAKKGARKRKGGGSRYESVLAGPVRVGGGPGTHVLGWGPLKPNVRSKMQVQEKIAPVTAKIEKTYSMRDSRFLDESLTKSAIFTSFFSGGPTPAATGRGPGPGPPRLCLSLEPALRVCSSTVVFQSI